MATVEELVKQYETDKALQKEVADILADGKVSMTEFMTFVKKHDVDCGYLNSRSPEIHGRSQKTRICQIAYRKYEGI